MERRKDEESKKHCKIHFCIHYVRFFYVPKIASEIDFPPKLQELHVIEKDVETIC